MNPDTEAPSQVSILYQTWNQNKNPPASKPFLSSGMVSAGDSDLMLSATLPVLPRGLPPLSHNSCKINTLYAVFIHDLFNDADSSLRLHTDPGVGLKLITNWRGSGKMKQWPNERFYDVKNN